MSKLNIDKSLLSYKLAQSEKEKIEFANLALKYRLYVSGWCLSKELVNLRIYCNSLNYEIGLTFYNDIPVVVILLCVCSLTWRENNHYMFFVKDSFRRNGIGTKMYESMKHKDNYFIARPTKDGIRFFDRIGLEYTID